MKAWLGIAATLLLGFMAAAAHSQSALPLPDYGVARDVPGAHMTPDPNVVHKVVFDAVTAAESIDDVNPQLLGVARYLNTLAKFGVPPGNRQIAVVLHQGSTEIILSNETFKARNDGHDNPNIDIIRALDTAGVQFHVCGQAVMGRDIDPKTIMPEIQLDLWALTTLIDLGRQGYVRIGG
jgi:intracellular sulfur oxidation DsrE/DsrF family protein